MFARLGCQQKQKAWQNCQAFFYVNTPTRCLQVRELLLALTYTFCRVFTFHILYLLISFKLELY